MSLKSEQTLLNEISLHSDLSLRLENNPKVQLKAIYGYTQNVIDIEKTICDGLQNKTLQLASSSISFSLTSDDNSDTQIIRISYYSSDISEIEEFQDVTLNGITKVLNGKTSYTTY